MKKVHGEWDTAGIMENKNRKQNEILVEGDLFLVAQVNRHRCHRKNYLLLKLLTEVLTLERGRRGRDCKR